MLKAKLIRRALPLLRKVTPHLLRSGRDKNAEWIVTPGRLLTRSRLLPSGTVFLVPISQYHLNTEQSCRTSFISPMRDSAVILNPHETQLTSYR